METQQPAVCTTAGCRVSISMSAHVRKMITADMLLLPATLLCMIVAALSAGVPFAKLFCQSRPPEKLDGPQEAHELVVVARGGGTLHRLRRSWTRLASVGSYLSHPLETAVNSHHPCRAASLAALSLVFTRRTSNRKAWRTT